MRGWRARHFLRRVRRTAATLRCRAQARGSHQTLERNSRGIHRHFSSLIRNCVLQTLFLKILLSPYGKKIIKNYKIAEFIEKNAYTIYCTLVKILSKMKHKIWCNEYSV